MKLLLRRRWLVCALYLFFCLPSLMAQTTLKVEKIEIHHVGPPAVSDDLIKANIHIKVGDSILVQAGDPISVPATDDDVLTLMGTGYFNDVRVAGVRTDGGINLIYVVQGKFVVTDIRVEGHKRYSSTKLLKKVTSKIGEPLDEFKLFRDAQEIQKLYEKAGYQRTKVKPEIVPNEALGRATVIFQVAEAPKVRIVDVEFVGAKAFSQRKLRKAIKTRRHWMFSWLTGSGKLKEDQFDEDKQKLKEFYWDEGYIDFEIKEVKFDQISPTRMAIRFIVFEGNRYRVGSVEFKGNTKFTVEQIRRGIPVLGKPIRPVMIEGEIFTPKGLQKDIEAIQDFYGAQGYIGRDDWDHVRVAAIKNPNIERGTMDLMYQIDEGEQSYVEKIEIKGNTKTKDKVIRRELAVSPGEVFDMVRVKLSKQRLEGLQYFTKVATEVEPTEVPYRKNLIVGVEEGSSGNFYVGAGFSSIEQVFGYVGMTQGNFDLFNPPFFTGGGQKLRLQATIGTRQENYEITFVEPWLFDRKLSFEVSLYHRDIQYFSDLYDVRQTGARFELTRALWVDSLRAGVNYTIENIGIEFDPSLTSTNLIRVANPSGHGFLESIVPPRISPTLMQEEGDRLVSKVGGRLVFDTRGGGLLPSRGQRTQLSAEVAGGPFGGDTDFYKLQLESSWYFRGPFEGHVLELGGRAGVVEPFGDSTRVPLYDRFFLGGATTLRGYKYRHVGPRDEFGEPIGGSTFWFGSAEYSVPIIERLRFAIFYDAGMVYPDAYDFDFSHYNDNWGIGLRINIPQMGPLRLDYGFPITHDPGTSGSGRFQFSVGYERPF